MAKTTRTYTSNGIQTNYPVDFTLGFINRDYVYVYLASDTYTNQLDYTWLSDSQIQLNNVPADGIDFIIRRVVPDSSLVNEYTDGAMLRKENLNDSYSQPLMLLEEIEDSNEETNTTVIEYIDTEIADVNSRVDNVETVKMDKVPAASTDNVVIFDSAGNAKDSGKKLNEVGNGGSYIGENPPTFPQQGDRWTRCTDMKGFIYYIDADSAQWVEDRPSYGEDTIGDVSVPYIFDTVADYQASTIVFPVGKTIHLNDRGADFTVIAGTGTANGFNIITSNSTGQSVDITQVAGFNTLEQLGYDIALENAHEVINTASLAGIQIKVTDNEFIFSDTIYIYSNGLVLTTETGEFSGAKLQASTSFDDTKLLVDTDNYNYLVANSVKVTTPDGGGIGSPKGTTILGVEFSGNYDASVLAAPLINEGIGARIYGGYVRLNLKVSNVFNTGVLTYYPEGASGVSGNNDNIIVTVSEITVHTSNTGREGYIFDGPPDAILGNVTSRDAASSNFGLQDVTLVDSVQYAGDTEKLCPAIDIRKACHHKGFMNGFGNRNGWSTHITNNRFDSSGQVQVDSSDGGLRIAPNGRGQISNIEFHGMTYGFITHSGSLRPCILNESVTGFTCKNIKGYLEGDHQGRNLVDVKGVGANMDIIVAPIFSNAPSNMGELLNIEGRQHNVNVNVSSTIAFSEGVVFGDLTESQVSGQMHLIGNNMLDFSGMSAARDKSNSINVVGRSTTGNPANILSGLNQLTRQDLTETKVSVYSTANSKTYSTQPSTRSADVTISDGSKTTSHSHNYIGTPNIDNIVIGFHPATTSTVMPEITNIEISNITGFSVEVVYDVLGGSGAMFVSSKINQ
jgi:hypothetical protein